VDKAPNAFARNNTILAARASHAITLDYYLCSVVAHSVSGAEHWPRTLAVSARRALPVWSNLLSVVVNASLHGQDVPARSRRVAKSHNWNAHSDSSADFEYHALRRIRIDSRSAPARISSAAN
jgi:hypothetical protein